MSARMLSIMIKITLYGTAGSGGLGRAEALASAGGRCAPVVPADADGVGAGSCFGFGHALVAKSASSAAASDRTERSPGRYAGCSLVKEALIFRQSIMVAQAPRGTQKPGSLRSAPARNCRFLANYFRTWFGTPSRSR